MVSTDTARKEWKMNLNVSNKYLVQKERFKPLEIQSLRAISVIAVVGYHYFANIFANG